jgi:anaerobic magnesium-protoporphyrin IX monomethyl ester cyclase
MSKDNEIPLIPSAPEVPKISYPALDKNIPQGNELRDYLANKEETGTARHQIESELVSIGEASEEWPRTLMMMPPITLSEGTVKRVIPPLGLAYIAGYLESVDIPFKILDCVVEGLSTEQLIGPKTWMYGLTDDDIRAYISDFRPEIVGISIMYSSDIHSLYRMARLVKEINPDTIVIAGGIHVSIYPREVLTESSQESGPTIDFIIRGEGEVRLAEFIRNFKNGVVDLKADGLCGWHGGEMFVNHQIKTIQNLDDMPLPAYHHLPMEKYFEFNVPFSPFPRGNRVMQIYTSRGCPVGCTFCASTNFNKGYRHRSPDNVIKEINYYKEKYNIDEIQFADDNLTFQKQRSLEFFEKLKTCGLQWCTPNGTMVNTLNEEVLDKMIDSGLYQITLSLDSGSAKTLKEHHRKPVKLQRIPDLAAYLKDRNILIHVTLVVGMPGEALEDIDEGYDFASNLPIDSIGVFIAQALPGSELFEVSIASGAIDREGARVIDTAQNSIHLSDIPKEILEKSVSEFLYKFNQDVKERDPESWALKYNKHKNRLKSICIGAAAPNTDGIIEASNPAPSEAYTGA